MQKIARSTDSHPQNDSTECESYEGVRTFMDMTENNLKEVQFERGNLLEAISNVDIFIYNKTKRPTKKTLLGRPHSIYHTLLNRPRYIVCDSRNFGTSG